MDDPLRADFDIRNSRDPLYPDYEKRLSFAPSTALRYYDTCLEEDQNRVIPGLNAVADILQRASPLASYDESKEPSLVGSGGLKLIVGSGDGQRQGLSLRSGDFFRILEEWRLPSTFAQSILTNNGSYARFTEYDFDDTKEVPSAMSVIFQTPYSPVANFSCVIKVAIADRSAKCLFFQKDKIRVDSLFTSMQARRLSLHKNPLSFISLLFEEHSYWCEEYRTKLDKDVVEMERQLGHTSIAISLYKNNPDYERLTRDLNACRTSLIFIDSVASFEKDVGMFCKESLEMLENLRQERGLDVLSLGERVAATQHLDYHLNLCQLRRVQAQSLEKRVQTQTSVLYSLISQRDSKLNISMARDSRNIAVAAKRDSTAMKTISVVTMVFLPGTFIASIFSAGIFDFHTTHGASRVEVSKYWWVYFVVTIILTLMTMAVWACYLKWRSYEDTGENGEKKQSKNWT